MKDTIPLHFLRAAIILAGALASLSSQAATNITQHGITWYFDRDYQAGQFVNGDWWVKGPVTITKITPYDNDLSDSVHKHGSMLNINPGLKPAGQAFDSRTTGGDNTYNGSNNVATRLPLNLQAGDALVSSISYETAADRPSQHSSFPYMRAMAVLTILDHEPAPGSFRPSYYGPRTSRVIKWSVDQLDFSRLPRYRAPQNTPTITSLGSRYTRPTLQMNKTAWGNTTLAPYENHEQYGREYANWIAPGLLLLCLDYSDAEKRDLLIRITQIGIDNYGAVTNGMRFPADGGHAHGRKAPIILAATVLNDANMLSICDAAKYRYFQDDSQFFEVSITDAVYGYTLNQVGMPEWATQPVSQPSTRNPQWSANYRKVVGSSLIGHVLMAKLMRVEAHWNNPVLFSYFETRYFPAEAPNARDITNEILPWIRDLWNLHQSTSAIPPANAHITIK